MSGSSSTCISVKAVDHIAIAVWSIEEALVLFQDVLGGEFLMGGDDERLGIRTVQLRLPPGVKIELLQPIRDDSFLHRFLRHRGPGVHHLTIIVSDLEAALEQFRALGFETIGTDLSSPTWRETFLRPKSTFGVLLQVVDTTLRWDQPIEGITLEDVLRGHVQWWEDRPRLRSPADLRKEDGENGGPSENS
ncbi:MAG: VOC family protein [Blastocatellia bacterium]|nr:VOC family protein [Blastocatellia bacterium]